MENDLNLERDFVEMLKLFWRERMTWISVGIFGLVIALLITWLYPWGYNGQVTVLVNRSNMQEAADYRYGGYYEIEASGRFTEVLAEMMHSPVIVKSIWEKAGVNSHKTLGNLKRYFKSEDVSNQQVEIKYSTKTEGEGVAVAEATFEILESKVNELNELSQKDASYNLMKMDPVVLPVRVLWWLNGLIGLILGGAIGLIFIAGKRYFKD